MNTAYPKSAASADEWLDALNLGKYKTALQMSSLGFLLACKEGCGGNPVLEALSYAGPAFLLASAVLATYSFLVYFSNVWKFMVGPTS